MTTDNYLGLLHVADPEDNPMLSFPRRFINLAPQHHVVVHERSSNYQGEVVAANCENMRPWASKSVLSVAAYI